MNKASLIRPALETPDTYPGDDATRYYVLTLSAVYGVRFRVPSHDDEFSSVWGRQSEGAKRGAPAGAPKLVLQLRLT